MIQTKPAVSRPEYIGIDRLRIVAALLVITIHTSPLLSFGEFPDYLFSRVFARLGVPFFFAATGFFVLAPFAGGQAGSSAIRRFVGKTAALYALAILLYLPVNIYAGHFQALTSPLDVARLLLVDGTMYHLWYLPASILGVILVLCLLRFVGIKAATLAAAALYIIGLLGDSYYCITSSVPWLARIYQGIFAFSGYTRNGLFYAPIFLLAGVWAVRRSMLPRKKCGIGFAASLLLLLAEGLALWYLGGQKHDSMYIALPLCVYLLISWLSGYTSVSRAGLGKKLRALAMPVYILHPWMIVLLRGAAKWMGWEAWLVDNSLVHYLAVCLLSFGAAGALLWLTALQKNKKKARAALHGQRAWMEISLDNLAHNLRVLQGMLPKGCRLMPALKANAYGFGAVPVAKALHKLGVRDFCVASLSEGIALRRKGVRGNILILGYTHPGDCRLVKRYRLMQTLVDKQHATQLAASGLRLKVHIKVDTGMHRLGQDCRQDEAIAALLQPGTLDVRGIFTQLACCDSPREEDVRYTQAQLAGFAALLAALQSKNLPLPKTHIQCSYGIINYADICADYARPGLALYGIVDPACCLVPPPNLKPIFAVRARVALTKSICAGQRVGYGSSFIAPQDMRIAVITIGYADGLPRSLSCGVGQVLLHGSPATIVGNICMDQAMIDISNIANVKSGDVVTVLGACDDSELSINTLAAQADTIPNEIASRFGQRLQRFYI